MVEVLKTGLFDTIQDMGRMEFRDFGVPISGVMDHYAFDLANSILGNKRNAAVIESTAFGPKLKFHQNTVISITGAYMHPKLNENILKNNCAISVTSGDVLSFGTLENGFRSYIAVLGGFQTENIMNSRSMYPNITSKSRLFKGDVMPILDASHTNIELFSSVEFNQEHIASDRLEVHKGPEFDRLAAEQQDFISNQEFIVSASSNRMAYQFDQCMDNQLVPIITSLVLPGSVQLTPSGKLITLMRDAQTTGGYPRILQLTESAINILSQKPIGSRVRFKCINW